MRLTSLALGLGLMLGPSAPPPAEITVAITMRYSHFSPARIDVRPGTTVRFVIRNADPIAHEFILGSEAQQALHEKLATPTHDGTPGQASLGIGDERSVVWTFDSPGTLVFACHRPGHYAYGMKGFVRTGS